MDSPDRPTNRNELERRRQANKPEPVIMDGQALTDVLWAQAAGQDSICGDFAAQIRRRRTLTLVTAVLAPPVCQ